MVCLYKSKYGFSLLKSLIKFLSFSQKRESSKLPLHLDPRLRAGDKFFACIIFIFGTLNQALSESFGNTMVGIPNLSLAFYDSSFIKHKKPWGLGLQYAAGMSFMSAIDYNWWWLLESDVGFGKMASADHKSISALHVGSGVRYHIFDEDIRPFLSLQLHYLHFLGEEAKNLPLGTSIPLWLGLKPTLGLEWLFFDEMALSFSVNYGFYVNLSEPFRHVSGLKLGYVIYF